VSLHVLDAGAAAMVRSACDAIVPGSGRVGPEVYVDALLAAMDDGARAEALGRFAAVAAAAAGGEEGMRDVAATPGFGQVRAMAVEAYYSDFVAPGAPGPGAWEAIGFVFPLVERLRKDWSFMGIG
jgi:long-chain-alcohol oxidase